MLKYQTESQVFFRETFVCVCVCVCVCVYLYMYVHFKGARVDISILGERSLKFKVEEIKIVDLRMTITICFYSATCVFYV
jgi:hypothetical protein